MTDSRVASLRSRMPASAITMGRTADHDGSEWAITMGETCASPSFHLFNQCIAQNVLAEMHALVGLGAIIGRYEAVMSVIRMPFPRRNRGDDLV
jgi:hypothetical protein